MQNMRYAIVAALLLAGCGGNTDTETPAAGSAAVTSSIPAGLTVIGEAMENGPRVTLAEIRKDPTRYFEQTLLVEGTAADVCQVKGCWLTLSDGAGEPIWVRWSSGCGGAYSFPKDAAGKRMLVQGSLYAKTISEADAEHLAAESEGLEAAEIAGDTFEINATACVVLASAEL
jgi:hypothetical protein